MIFNLKINVPCGIYSTNILQEINVKYDFMQMDN
ncbi:hypothetical protein BH11BAC3_BH11BAC3_09400 [soil metagenome]